MKLVDVVRELDSFDDDSVIYAAEPWNANSAATVVRELPGDDSAANKEALGLAYFLEVSVAREFLEGWVANLGSQPSLDHKCSRLVQYAVNDA
jgi:hypothetical protein